MKRKFKRPASVIRFKCNHRWMAVSYRNHLGYKSTIALDVKVTPDGRMVEFSSSEKPAEYILALRERLISARPEIRRNISVIINGSKGALSVSKCQWHNKKDIREFKKFRHYDRINQAETIRKTGMLGVVRRLREEFESVKLKAHATIGNTYEMAAPSIVIDDRYEMSMRLLKGVHTWVVLDKQRSHLICRTQDTIKAIAAVKKSKLKEFLNV